MTTTPLISSSPANASGGKVWDEKTNGASPKAKMSRRELVFSITGHVFLVISILAFTIGSSITDLIPHLTVISDTEAKYETLYEIEQSVSAPYYTVARIAVVISLLSYIIAKYYVIAVLLFIVTLLTVLFAANAAQPDSSKNRNATDMNQIASWFMDSNDINLAEARQVYAPILETNQPGKIELADGSTILYTLNRDPETHIIKPEITSWTKGEPVETGAVDKK